jgi:hypothetical protein
MSYIPKTVSEIIKEFINQTYPQDELRLTPINFC